jgi:excisionase family DNA binding protein
MPIVDLATHPTPFVTIAELAKYWCVSRRHIHKRIESGALAAIQLGSRLYRVRTQVALEFERQASVLGETSTISSVSTEERMSTSASESERGDRSVTTLGGPPTTGPRGNSATTSGGGSTHHSNAIASGVLRRNRRPRRIESPVSRRHRCHGSVTIA